MTITVVTPNGWKTTVADTNFQRGEKRALYALFLMKGSVDSRTDVVYDSVECALEREMQVRIQSYKICEEK